MLETTVTASLSIAGKSLSVLGYTLEQSLDSIDQVTCELDASSDELEQVQNYLSKVGHFRLTTDGTSEVELFCGEVISARDAIQETGSRIVIVTVAAPLWRLTRRMQSQIFQNRTIEQIVQQKLSDAGVTVATDWHGTSHRNALPYVVQFEETDYDFVARLLGEHGITLGYETKSEDEDEDEHEDGDGENEKKDPCKNEGKLWFSDNPAKRSTGAPLQLPFKGSFGHQSSANTVDHLVRTEALRPSSAHVTAYDERHSSLAIEGKATSKTKDGEIYAPLARDRSATLAKSAAERVVASYQGRRSIVRGRTASTQLISGLPIEVLGHPYAPQNGKYLVTSVRTSGRNVRSFTAESEDLRTVEFTAVPLDVPLVPQRRPSARLIPGIQTAITTGSAGEEIHTNAHGEVTVRFAWDRKGKKDDTSSRFMRTSQVPTGGSMLLPRVGWEVVVAYHEGDADHPFVMSRLYNAETMPPYALPEGALRSSLQTGTTPGDGSSNELRMDDTKGNEQMMFNASRDMSVQVGNNSTQSVGNDLAIVVGANQKHTVIGSSESTVGANQTIEVTGNQNASIATMGVDDIDGSHTATVSGNRIQMIGGDHRSTVEGANALQVSGNAMTAVIGTVSVDTAANFSHDVGAALIQVSGGSRSLTIGGAHSETTAAAKVLVANGVRSLEVGSLALTVGGALLLKAQGDRSDSACTGLTETAGGAQKIEAANIAIEGALKVSLTMGGATITLTPASISISGSSVKLDGSLLEMAPLIVDN